MSLASSDYDFNNCCSFQRDTSVMVKPLVAIIPAVLVVATAILSVQNATPISITFLRASTVALPVGIWLAFGLGVGMAGTALLLSLFGMGRKARGDRL